MRIGLCHKMHTPCWVIGRALSKSKMKYSSQGWFLSDQRMPGSSLRYFSSQMDRVPAINPITPSTFGSIERDSSLLLINYRTYSSSPPLQKEKTKRKRVVIIGSGWAGFKFLQDIDQTAFEVIVVSPRNYFLFTPLLASTCVGTLEFRSIIEPVRSASQETRIKLQNIFKSSSNSKKHQHEGLVYHEASVDAIDLKHQSISCKSALSDGSEFSLLYDYLVIACGAKTNTFGIPGVDTHAHFLKDIKDARGIRYRIMELFEQAANASVGPSASANDAKIRQLLHFVVVGGGPTGVEFSAELHDFIKEDVSRLYPGLMDKVHMTLVDVAPKILLSFDKRLSDYTSSKFSREGMTIRTETFVKEVTEDQLLIKDGPPIPYGLLVWSTGLAPNKLVTSLKDRVVKNEASGRLVTDGHFRLLSRESAATPIPTVFAIGDCATIVGHDLPATAQVAKQKAKVLARYLNDTVRRSKPIAKQNPFSYHDLGSMAYIGGWKAIVALPVSHDGERKWNDSGIIAWLLWRSAYFSMTVSWRNKVLIPVYWILTWIFGRDMTHIK